MRRYSDQYDAELTRERRAAHAVRFSSVLRGHGWHGLRLGPVTVRVVIGERRAVLTCEGGEVEASIVARPGRGWPEVLADAVDVTARALFDTELDAHGRPEAEAALLAMIRSTPTSDYTGEDAVAELQARRRGER